MAYHADKLDQLNAFVEQHTPQEGIGQTGLENLGTFKSSTTHVRMPTYYDPALIIVGQGKKRCYIGNHTYEYGAGDYLVLFLPMSLEVELIEASPDKPFLALREHFVTSGKVATIL